MILRDQRRQVAFNNLREATYDVLQQELIAERLGETGLAITEALESSFLIPREGKDIVMPQEQEDTDNIGIHPVLATELKPSISYNVALRSVDRQYLQSRADPLDFQALLNEPARKRKNTLGSTLRSFIIGGYTNCGYLPLEFEDDSSEEPSLHRFYCRPNVFVNFRSLLLSAGGTRLNKIYAASIMAHEVDHALKSRDRESNGLAELEDKDEEDEVVSLRKESVLVEEHAYGISARIIAPRKQKYFDGHEISKKIKGLEPEEAGKRVRRLNPLWRRYMGAAALTKMFRTDPSIPSDDEVTAYLAAGLIH